jgi:hypothetical protein
MGREVIPIIVIIDPDNVQPGSQVEVTVKFNQAPVAGNQQVAISGDPSGFFSSLPSSVTLQIGQTQLSFGATVSANAQGQGTITASCNGGSAQGSCSVNP